MMDEGRTSGIIQRLLESEPAFRQFIRRRVGDEGAVQDILQQSLTRAVERYHSLHNEESVLAWFYRILHHAVADYYRSQGSEARRNKAFLEELTTSGNHQEPPPDEVQAAACACLHGLLPTLRGNYAELIKRIDLDGESPACIAKELKISRNNLTVRLHRARQSLRASLEDACGICSKHGCLSCTCG
ncbi:MAG: sigma-70 family RNA polymerase sigma factor [Nitrospira sp.]|nr:sigma-70 family RNA polymerase sigma factor [Nitrospira sp.]